MPEAVLFPTPPSATELSPTQDARLDEIRLAPSLVERAPLANKQQWAELSPGATRVQPHVEEREPASAEPGAFSPLRRECDRLQGENQTLREDVKNGQKFYRRLALTNQKLQKVVVNAQALNRNLEFTNQKLTKTWLTHRRSTTT